MALNTKIPKKRISRAGRTILDHNVEFDDLVEAYTIVENWRSHHVYPLNTFQATLRNKLKKIDKKAIVAQRLKRMPSIVGKLERFPDMQLARMQDIGGLRAVVINLQRARRLEANYLSSRFQHKLVNHKDYIKNPKPSGYRGIHLVYQNKNSQAPYYDGLFVEIQIRTKIQHAWATAVETMGVFLEEALKASEGPEEWLDFFTLAGSAFACLEESPPIDLHKNWQTKTIYKRLAREAKRLNVKDRLRAFTVAADRIVTDFRRGNLNLLVLNTKKKTVRTQSFSFAKREIANNAYAKVEREISEGEPLMAVLVSTGRVKDLRKAYPNYFLDTREFINILGKIEQFTDLD